jgi:predicted DNA binding CopG/RHH family protein
MPRQKLEQEEKDILESFESGEWESVGKKSFSKYQAIAKETLKKDKRINIRIKSSNISKTQ